MKYMNVRSLGQHTAVLLSCLVIVAALVSASFALRLAPKNPYSQDLANRLIVPFESPASPLGTDYLGRDTLSRLMLALRYSMAIGIISAISATVIGVSVGMLAGYFGGRLDSLVSVAISARMAFPFVLLVLVLVVVFRPSLETTVLALTLTLWVRHAVSVRSLTQSLRQAEYIEAAASLGASHARILLRHILPNVSGQVLVLTTIVFSEALLAEAFLSFLGLGVQLPTPSLGNMIAESRVYAFNMWWLAGIPGAAIFLVCISVNTLGDYLARRS